MSESGSPFPAVRDAVQQGIDRQLHTGVQIYASLDGQPVLNTGFSEAAIGRDINKDHILLWRSAGKPLTAVAVLLAAEQGQLSLDDTLADHLEEARERPWSTATLRSLLTHSSQLPVIETGWPESSWMEIIERICAAEGTGPQAAYQPQATWFLLGEILSRTDPQKRSFSTILHDDVLRPMNLQETWCGLPDDVIESRRSDLPEYFSRERGELVPSPFSEQLWLTAASPGGNLRGPVRQLGRFYEMLLAKGRLPDGSQFLPPATVEAMTARHRVDLYDETLQHTIDFGLGVIVDSNHHGIRTVPYGFGIHCSPGTFGHGGSQCAMGFCDPAKKLVVAWAANGFCGEGQHQRRNRLINEAVYEDLGFI